jgi:hypothetical protein
MDWNEMVWRNLGQVTLQKTLPVKENVALNGHDLPSCYIAIKHHKMLL